MKNTILLALQKAVKLAEKQSDEMRNFVLQAALLGLLLRNGVFASDSLQLWRQRFELEISPDGYSLLEKLLPEEPAIAEVIAGVPSPKSSSRSSTPVDSTPQSIQSPYHPRSEGRRLGALVPGNMAAATELTLNRLVASIGNVDDYVCDRVGFDSKEQLWDCLFAEQVDCVALAIWNLECGKGFVIGDQAGFGKGTELACLMRYAIRQGLLGIWSTKEPSLYSDAVRDLSRVGLSGFIPFMTDSSQKIPLPDGRIIKSAGGGAHDFEMQGFMRNGKLTGYDGIFTTYSQMQTVAGSEPLRRDFLRQFAQQSILLLDESHEAGGTENMSWVNAGTPSNRAEFARELTNLARGVIYSSATYAKNPFTMTLYATTDIGLAVDKPERLVSLMKTGGVPLQQAIAAMLVESGGYLRRERSFDGVDILTQSLAVDSQLCENMAAALRVILWCDRYIKLVAVAKDKAMKAAAKAIKNDQSIGKVGAESIGFTSIMHNLIDQFLLSLKTNAAIDQALALLDQDQKVVIAVSNTMGSFLGKYAAINNINPGDFIDVTFSDLLLRYLNRSRVLILQDHNGVTDHHFITDDELKEVGGHAAVDAFARAKHLIQSLDFSGIPISPIDWMHYRFKRAGRFSAEITGRLHCLDYTAAGYGFYSPRPAKDRNKAASVKVRDRFNSGLVDVLIINRSGSTGISLHSDKSFLDQRRRNLLLVQPEKDINHCVQTLFRVHRTGQTVAPAIHLLVGDTPAERRPASVLLYKLSRLNANVIASRSGQLNIEGAIDLINEIGDAAAESVLLDNPTFYEQLDFSLESSPFTKGEPGGIIRQVTGRIPLLPVKEQERLYQLLEAEYQALEEQAEATGEGRQEAYQLDFQAKMVSQKVLIAADPGSDSPFTDSVYQETLDTRSLDRIIRQIDAITAVRGSLNLPRVKNIEKHDFSAVEQIARDKAQKLVEAIRQKTLQYRTNQLSLPGLSPPDPSAPAAEKQERQAKIDRFEELILGQFRKTTLLILKFPLGTTVRVIRPDGMIRYGVVTRIWSNENSQNPVALGNWKMQFVIAGTDGLLKPINFRQINTGEDNQTQVEEVDKTNTGVPIYQYFDQFQSSDRVTRTVLTGNILRAYERFQNVGRIINFSMDNGSKRQGILLQPGANTAEILEKSVLKLSNMRVAMILLVEHGATLKSVDETLAIHYRDRAVTVETSKTTQIGGRWFKNSRLLSAAESEFYSIGNRMQMVVSTEKLLPILETLGVVSFFGDRQLALKLLTEPSLKTASAEQSPYA